MEPVEKSLTNICGDDALSALKTHITAAYNVFGKMDLERKFHAIAFVKKTFQKMEVCVQALVEDIYSAQMSPNPQLTGGVQSNNRGSFAELLQAKTFGTSIKTTRNKATERNPKDISASEPASSSPNITTGSGVSDEIGQLLVQHNNLRHEVQHLSRQLKNVLKQNKGAAEKSVPTLMTGSHVDSEPKLKPAQSLPGPSTSLGEPLLSSNSTNVLHTGTNQSTSPVAGIAPEKLFQDFLRQVSEKEYVNSSPELSKQDYNNIEDKKITVKRSEGQSKEPPFTESIQNNLPDLATDINSSSYFGTIGRVDADLSSLEDFTEDLDIALDTTTQFENDASSYDKAKSVCRLCRQTFLSKPSLVQHLKKYGPGKVTCRVCSRVFYNEAMLTHHTCAGAVARRPYGQKRHCHLCSETFTNFVKLQKHLKSVHNEKHYEQHFICKECNKGFTKKASLFAHYKKHFDHVCQRCGKTFDSREQLEQHDRDHINTAQFICEKCGATTSRSQAYLRHLEAHAKYDCETCGESCTTNAAYRHHRLVAHGYKVPVFTEEHYKFGCKECGRHFPRPSMLEQHTRLHSGEKPCRCIPCNLSFRTPHGLGRHQQSLAHKETTGKSSTELEHLCPHCGKKFSQRRNLMRHLKCHASESQVQKCPYCDYQGHETTGLKRHMVLHFSKRNFVCETCGDSFYTKKTLESHKIYKHSSSRPYSCETCRMTFKTRQSLIRHRTVHDNSMVHNCPLCGSGFNRFYNLRRHMKAVHGTDSSLPPPKRVKLVDVSEISEYAKGTTRRRIRREKVVDLVASSNNDPESLCPPESVLAPFFCPNETGESRPSVQVAVDSGLTSGSTRKPSHDNVSRDMTPTNLSKGLTLTTKTLPAKVIQSNLSVGVTEGSLTGKNSQLVINTDSSVAISRVSDNTDVGQLAMFEADMGISLSTGNSRARECHSVRAAEAGRSSSFTPSTFTLVTHATSLAQPSTSGLVSAQNSFTVPSNHSVLNTDTLTQMVDQAMPAIASYYDAANDVAFEFPIDQSASSDVTGHLPSSNGNQETIEHSSIFQSYF